jgi:hypothetical protein
VAGEISAEHAAVTSHNAGKQKNATRKRSIQPPDFEVWNRKKTGTIGLDRYVLPEIARCQPELSVVGAKLAT